MDFFTESMALGMRRRFWPNLLSNGCQFLLSVAVGIWFVPYLIRHLGAAGYGLVPLAMSVTGYMLVVTLAMNAAIGRNMTIALERRNLDEANQYFNASFWGGLAAVALLAIAVTPAIAWCGRWIHIPAGMEMPARRLLAASSFMFFTSTLAAPFDTATYCRNRLDIKNAVMMGQQLAYLAIVIIWFTVAGPSLDAVAAGLAAAGVINLALAVLTQRRLLPALHVSWKEVKAPAVKSLLRFGGWAVVTHLGSLLFFSVDILIVNRMIGPAMAGKYAALLQWPQSLRTLAWTVARIFGPLTMHYHAQHDHVQLMAYTRRAQKFMGLLFALPFGLACGLAAPLLTVWLGPEYECYALVMILMMVYWPMCLTAVPLNNLQLATGKVRLPGLVTCFMGLGYIALALFMVAPQRGGVIGLALSGLIMVSAKDVLFMPWHCARILRLPWWTFLGEGLVAMGATLVVAVPLWVMTLGASASWGRIMMAAPAITLAYGFVAWHWLLAREDRAIALHLLPHPVARLIAKIMNPRHPLP
jgi:membrane protein EpsK